jgi:hypothetical protein
MGVKMDIIFGQNGYIGQVRPSKRSWFLVMTSYQHFIEFGFVNLELHIWLHFILVFGSWIGERLSARLWSKLH